MKVKILARLIYWFIRLLNFTYRYHFIGLENRRLAEAMNPQKTFIYALWHQNLVGAIFSHIGDKFSMVISESKDGELVAVTCENLGHAPARGSSTRGGKKALLEIVKNIKSGIPGAISVDGPKGPAKIVKPGVIEVAKLCHCAIVPMSPYASSFWVFHKSWDRFRVPKPFCKIVIVIGKPIVLHEHIERSEFEKSADDIRIAIIGGEEVAKKYLRLT